MTVRPGGVGAPPGSGTRNQAHGSPGNLPISAVSDIPETEIFGPPGSIPGLWTDPTFDNEPPDLLMLKLHVGGTQRRNRWSGGDVHVAASISRFPGAVQAGDRPASGGGYQSHCVPRTPYSPMEAAWPGWPSCVSISPTNTWWDDFSVHEYIARSQAPAGVPTGQ